MSKATRNKQGEDSILSRLLNGLAESIRLDGVVHAAREAGAGFSGFMLEIARTCITSAAFEAAVFQMGDFLKSPDGIKWQKSHNIALEMTKDGTAVKLPGRFRNHYRNLLRYLELHEVCTDLRAKGIEAPEIPALTATDAEGKPVIASESKCRAIVAEHLDLLARAKIQSSEASDTAKAVRLAALDRDAKVDAAVNRITKAMGELVGDNATAALPALVVCGEALEVLVKAQRDAQAKAKQEAEALKAQKAHANKQALEGLPVTDGTSEAAAA